MSEPMKLVTTREQIAVDIHAKLLELAGIAENEDLLGMAVVMARKGGGSWVATLGKNNRVLLLGAVTDLQYTIAKSGDG